MRLLYGIHIHINNASEKHTVTIMVNKGRKCILLSFGENLKFLLCLRRDSPAVKANIQPWWVCGVERKGGDISYVHVP